MRRIDDDIQWVGKTLLTNVESLYDEWGGIAKANLLTRW
jgi:hypothetical protein